MGVPEAEVRLVEGMYKGMKGRVLVGPRISEELSVNVSLRQGSALSPLMWRGEPSREMNPAER